ncbi:YihY/virulence factor BrkB family protein [Alloacidobacterium dinghuense]|uniref:YihY/virulence factor BrkB family protein n=1 Tax=Alloacidobacterium dinghuense TaxID=2763107 RepID=A0A7G8BJD8_9BACT|nr:YihY/virulence factor BrkB family protein [Alloacidobacterium dinghuense]QNI32658.1 YihY/virulence factor BrkB family protein [Alloacidobacterium dinghuense]
MARSLKYPSLASHHDIHGAPHMIATEKLRGEVERTCRSTGSFILLVYRELIRTRVFTAGAGLAFYFTFSLVPLLIVFASLLWYLPVTTMVSQLLAVLAALIPQESMQLVQTMILSVLGPGHAKVLSFGIFGYLWAATGGFSGLIEALDIAYDVTNCRSWWRERLQALLLTFTVGGLALLSLLALVVGPEFGHFLRIFFSVPETYAHIWPVLRWIFTIVTFVAGVELVYWLGPHARHSFWSTLPGAAVAVAMWFLGSFGLSFYLGHLSNYNKTYGSLGAVAGFMLWLYISSLAVLIGAEFNAELVKRRRARQS